MWEHMIIGAFGPLTLAGCLTNPPPALSTTHPASQAAPEAPIVDAGALVRDRTTVQVNRNESVQPPLASIGERTMPIRTVARLLAMVIAFCSGCGTIATDATKDELRADGIDV